MDRLRLVVAVAATFVLASIGVAVAANGDPLIIGAHNEGTNTVLTSGDNTQTTFSVFSEGEEAYALDVSNGSFEATSAAATFWGSGGDALVVQGATITDHVTIVTVPAGQRKVTFEPDRGDGLAARTVEEWTVPLATTLGDGPAVQNVLA